MKTVRGGGYLALAAALSAVGGILPGCGPANAPELPVPATVLDVTMSDFRFTHQSQVAAGRVVLRARNAGAVQHEIVLVEMPEDLPRTIGEQLRGPERQGFLSVAYLPPRPPATSGTFAVDLTPGRYALVCFVRDDKGMDHARLGMGSELRVR